jgi:hypothetical protein
MAGCFNVPSHQPSPRRRVESDRNILGYAGRHPEARGADRRPVSRGTVRCCAGLAMVALHTCVWIEVLNALAGSYLPRDAAGGDTGKWRTSPAVTELDWRRLQGMFNQDRTLLTRPLSPAEDAAMRADVARARRMNRLRSWVSGPGLLQYLLVPLVVLQSVHAIAHPRPDRLHLVGWATLAAALACGASMVYRGYYSSLGI